MPILTLKKKRFSKAPNAMVAIILAVFPPEITCFVLQPVCQHLKAFDIPLRPYCRKSSIQLCSASESKCRLFIVSVIAVSGTTNLLVNCIPIS